MSRFKGPENSLQSLSTFIIFLNRALNKFPFHNQCCNGSEINQLAGKIGGVLGCSCQNKELGEDYRVEAGLICG